MSESTEQGTQRGPTAVDHNDGERRPYLEVRTAAVDLTVKSRPHYVYGVVSGAIGSPLVQHVAHWLTR